jgi:hypothetical protein
MMTANVMTKPHTPGVTESGSYPGVGDGTGDAVSENQSTMSD